MPDANADLFQEVVNITRAAGDMGMKFFNKDPQVWTKGNDSPVTEADLAIDTYLKEHLLALESDLGWLSEETEDDPARLEKKRLFIVDPIDGTRGFINGSDEWLVSVAVVEEGRPTIGVLYAPVTQTLFTASVGQGAYRDDERISVAANASLENGLFGVPARISRSIQDELTSQVQRAPHCPSLAYRIAYVADARWNGAVARPSSNDWDIAAADLVLSEAGGALVGVDGRPVRYNRESTEHDWLIAAPNDLQKALIKAACEAIEKEK